MSEVKGQGYHKCSKTLNIFLSALKMLVIRSGSSLLAPSHPTCRHKHSCIFYVLKVRIGQRSKVKVTINVLKTLNTFLFLFIRAGTRKMLVRRS